MPDMNILRQLANDVGADTALTLMGIFKKDTDTRIAHIRFFLENGGDEKDLRIHAHSLQSLCLTYGATAGSAAARDLEEACDGTDPAHIAALAQAAVNIIPADVTATMTAMTELTVPSFVACDKSSKS